MIAIKVITPLNSTQLTNTLLISVDQIKPNLMDACSDELEKEERM